MKFVYFGYDFMLPAIQRALDEGHELTGIFSFECDNIFNFNRQCQALAQKRNVPFIISKAEDFHLNPFLDKGVELFFAAGYPYKIPPIDPARAYAVNLHPTYLPKARGLMPIPRIILENMIDAAGLTAHKMTQDFDAGDILLQEKVNLSPNESVETYSAKIALRAPELVSNLFTNLPELWNNASVQDENKATTIKPPSDHDRLLNWNESIENIARTARAFGNFGSLASFDEQLWVVYNLDVWKEDHALPPGTIAARLSRETLVAAQNGFVCLKDYQPARIE
ncbi:MAG TPA: formyltransferase family protein [Alphaproteobacteria bacterium]|nr:hypothetical protein [Alphaproteobacteria bacterium]USO05536.1 MAG: hypothetical protein H6859_10485 [Rhodospirillales bacterium]HOO82424.1 formyltransferase family protein [Alphaproteobacteria bacterium]